MLGAAAGDGEEYTSMRRDADGYDDDDDDDDDDDYLPPVLVFVNGKSGGRRGEQLTQELANRADLSPLEVVDLTRTGPRVALARFVGRIPGLRVVVCGGDGTVAWVLQALEDLKV